MIKIAFSGFAYHLALKGYGGRRCYAVEPVGWELFAAGLSDDGG